MRLAKRNVCSIPTESFFSATFQDVALQSIDAPPDAYCASFALLTSPRRRVTRRSASKRSSKAAELATPGLIDSTGRHAIHTLGGNFGLVIGVTVKERKLVGSRLSYGRKKSAAAFGPWAKSTSSIASSNRPRAASQRARWRRGNAALSSHSGLFCGAPFPVANFRQVLTVLANVLLVPGQVHREELSRSVDQLFRCLISS